MLTRLLLPAFALLVPMSFAQVGNFGTATGHPKAGDTAPDLVFSQLLRAPEPGSWTQANLSGQVTVLSFFPDTSHNPKPVADWNARVTQYAGKPVQFVWITSEERQKLMPALAEHPIEGWVLYDPKNSTAKAYGLDMPVNIYIGPDRKIIGFQQGYIPDTRTLDAVLEGRITHTRPTQSNIKAFIQSNLVLLDAQPAMMPRATDHRPKFTPSYTVHITPSHGEQNGNSSSNDFWVLQGVTVKDAIEILYDTSSARVLLPPSLDDGKRYDFAMLLPKPESREKMSLRMKQGLQDYFHVTMQRETRLTDVYVVSVVSGRKPAALPPDNDSLAQFRAASIGFRGTGGLDEAIQSSGRPEDLKAMYSVFEEGTMGDLCRDLEYSLDRPVVNETELEGAYKIQVQIPLDSNVDFLQRLRDETGLVISPGQRNVEFLNFQPTVPHHAIE